MTKRRLVTLGQVAASVTVLVLLVRDADTDLVLEALSGAALPWLVAAIAFKCVSLSIHELRLWIALLPWKRQPFWTVMAIGYTSGLVNAILPARGGDLAAVGLLKAELDVPAPQALAAVGITAFMEALAFFVFLLGVLIFGATQWEIVLGAAKAATAMSWVTGVTVGAVFGATALVLIGRRLRQPEEEAPRGPGPLAFLRQTIVDTGEGLSAWGPLAAQVATSALQVAVLMGCFLSLFPALHLEPPLPALAASGVIVFASLAAIVLPPSMGAGQAATAVFVLGAFGIGEADAIAYAALSWVANSSPPALLGFVPLWRRLGRLPEILAATRSQPGSR